MGREATVELGVFSRTFERSGVGEVLDAVASHGFPLVHFNLRSMGLATIPPELSEGTCTAVNREVQARGLAMVGVSATFNAIHPDRQRRGRETELACQLIALAPALGTTFVSLSTGTRDPDDMWRRHPANDEASAWDDLHRTLDRLLDVARHVGVTLGIEPEQSNVVSSARQARRLLDEFGDDHLKIILDPANLLTPVTVSEQRTILDEAFDLLAPDVVVAHAKDLSKNGDVAAGRGLLDYQHYFELLRKHRLSVPIIVHEVEEPDIPRVRQFILQAAQGMGPNTAKAEPR